MQEKTTPVFVVATANKHKFIAPELLRKGRFDEIYFVDLPNKDERKKIFSIHLKRKSGSNKFCLGIDQQKIRRFNGAEIEECIKEASLLLMCKIQVLLSQTKHIVDVLGYSSLI
jgi:SpoVK/Ycf46/Vps4 family AAA+-type ATPase